ncbi:MULTISPECIES: DUF6497 family protein [unclassified Ruegeria]|uniref:DUF6497 family protein n=2 Tax=Ruegeria TaxID=97050 RepID=UPI0014877974|nr:MULTISPECIES: DUF6497 family protein [unclassified Ruegeria]NOD74675.1 hypothetical protein [Ruegeria sp. HKCCD4332]NOD88591.1 hypothetical protein [Ruegeria sp. HKCCD4318]NOE12181.1 hypothetical protein [Ruegeria sp. HKCCD4318-2]NOG09654.1 hypothetical protein [Ruegeria sp. HKCCD4315]
MIRPIRHRTAQFTSTARAIPEGGARPWRVRDRAICLMICLACSPVFAQSDTPLPVPSGQPVHLDDVLLDNNPGELWVRFRFIAPKIGATVGRITYDVASKDMEHLCQILAVPYVAQHDLQPVRVVISLADRPVEFGDAAPDATQFFEAYRLEQSRCIWEGL